MPLLLPLALGAALAAPPTALGDPGYAVVVASHRPGPGQQPLSWARRDADRVAAVLSELGGLASGDVLLLEDPGADDLFAALDRVAARMAADEARGRKASLVFYYSGHARAQGLDLGGEGVPLDDLRAALEALPARVRLVVLDACQSGAVSGVKGVAPAAAFSTASVGGLSAEGTAILASSTATELSQESDALQGSTFTHHLVVGLRGAADDNRDGTVTLDEAYAYTYDRTVLSSAQTAVGRQHPVLETDLRGRGGVALTRLDGARARLRFTAEDAGEVLLSRGGVVMAEVSKAGGDALTLALPAGDYEVWQTRGDRAERCALTLPAGDTADYQPERCVRVRPEATAAKGASTRAPAETWGLELGLGPLQERSSPYTERLTDFGFAEQPEWLGNPAGTVALAWSPLRNLAVVGTFGNLGFAGYTRDRVTGPDAEPAETTFTWRTRRVTLAARAQLPVARDWLVPYAQVGGGPAWVPTLFDDPATDTLDPETQLGWHGSAGGGLQLMPTSRDGQWRHLGLFAQAEVVTAPVLENLLGDRHDAGGLLVTLGLRGAL